MRISTGLLIVAAAILIAVGGLVLVQRLYSTDQRKQHNDVAGFIYAVLGVAYAVLLGLMLIAVWEKWNAAEALTTDEANELAGIFWFAHALPQPEGRHIQELVRSYAQVVVEDEWPLMAQGRSSPKAWATLDELRATILGLNPPRVPSKWATTKCATTKCWSSSTTWVTQGGRDCWLLGRGCPRSCGSC